MALYETLKDAYLLHLLETKKKKQIKDKRDEKIIKTENSDKEIILKHPPALVLLSIGAFSSACGQIIVYPLALVRTKLQV